MSPQNQDFLIQLRTLGDSVIHTYLSEIADTAEKRNYLHVFYTATIAFRLVDPLGLEASLSDMTQILELYPPTFQPCRNPCVLLTSTSSWKVLGSWQTNYVEDFLSNPERSKLFYYDLELWSTFVAARYMRYLRRTSDLRCYIRFKKVIPCFNNWSSSRTGHFLWLIREVFTERAKPDNPDLLSELQSADRGILVTMNAHDAGKGILSSLVLDVVHWPEVSPVFISSKIRIQSTLS